ncbi:MAG: hypothetical protein IJA66_07475 [Alistipes sp.]|nr:hypothetical protein [Alistipes sp.]
MIILFPTELESAPFRAICPDAEVFICGVGMAQTAACVARLLADGHRSFLLAGIAGAYDQTLAKGEVVAVAEERVAGLPMQFDRTYRATILPEGLQVVRSNTVSACGAEAQGAEVENMEGAALFALCEEFGAECCEVRAISNRVGEPREEWDVPTALESLAHAVQQIISKQ